MRDGVQADRRPDMKDALAELHPPGLRHCIADAVGSAHADISVRRRLLDLHVVFTNDDHGPRCSRRRLVRRIARRQSQPCGDSDNEESHFKIPGSHIDRAGT